MATTPTPSHPQFTFLFQAAHHTEARALPHREAVITMGETSTRSLLAFADHSPVQEVHHV